MYRIRSILQILQSVLTASLLLPGQTALKDVVASLQSAESEDAVRSLYGDGMQIALPLFRAVFGGVLKLNKMLNAFYGDAFVKRLAPQYRSLTMALDVKSLYNGYGLNFEYLLRNPAEKKAEILALEKAMIWIQTTRCVFVMEPAVNSLSLVP